MASPCLSDNSIPTFNEASQNLKDVMLPENDMYQMACITYSLCVHTHSGYNELYVAQNIHTNLTLAYPFLAISDVDRIGTILQERVKNMFCGAAPLPIEYDTEMEVEEQQYCENCYEPIDRVILRDEVFNYTYCSTECRRQFME